MQQQDSYRLVVRRGPQPNQTYELTNELTTLGRDITNDIVINDRETSRHHLRILRSGNAVTIEDLGSTNGTFANGKRVSGVTTLQNGDMVGLGETVTLGFEIQRIQHQPPVPNAPAMQDMPTPAPAPLTPGDMPPAEDAYLPEQPAYGYPPPAESFTPPPAQPQQPPQMQQPAYYGQPPAAYQVPAPPPQYAGYEYDPYAAREESGGGSQWLVLGCFVFFVLVFVCFGFVALLVIDTLNWWCELPVLTEIVTAFGYCGF